MKTDDLIAQLSQDLKPVRPLEKWWVFASKWTLALAFFVALLVIAVRPRADLIEELKFADFWLDLLGFTLLLFSSLALAAWSSSPGRAGFGKYLRALMALIGFLFVAQVLSLLHLNSSAMADGANALGTRCSVVAMIAGVVTGAFITWKVRRGASTRPLMTGLILGFATAGAGGIAITLHCSSQNEMHILVWHFLVPLVMMAALGTLTARKFLRW